MLTGQDDLLGHQAPTTFDHVVTSDPAWMERYWYTGHRVPGGDVIFEIGLGLHLNKNVMDAYVGITIAGVQRNLRLSRRARPDPLSAAIGPLSIRVVDGLKAHRLTVAPNDSGITMDVEFTATMNPHEELHHFRRRAGRVTEDMERYHQIGRYKGWIAVDGQRFELTPETWWGQRDHSWGVRAELRTDESRPPLSPYPPLFFIWAIFQFADHGIHLFANERAPADAIYLSGEQVFALGAKREAGQRIVAFSHDIEFEDDPLGQSVKTARIGLNFADGRSDEVQLRRLPARYYLKGGLYGGLKGWSQGDDKGKLYLEHDRWNLEDAADRRLARTLSSNVVEVRHGKEVGYGICQWGVTKGYPKYEQVQHHPVP